VEVLMRGLLVSLGLAVLLGTPAAAQTTMCNPVGTFLMCTTTAPPPAPNYSQGMGALGAAIGSRLSERREQKAQTDANSTVAAFAADAAHPYYGLVRLQMAAHLEAGRARTLQEAYDMAVAADPTVQALKAAGR
jgi:hypothetical protein